MRVPRTIGLTLALLGACGVPQEVYDTRVRELDRCRTDQSRAQLDLTAAQRNADELAGEASDLRDKITAIEGDRARLSTNLSTQKQNLDLFKSATTLAERRVELYQKLVSLLRPLVDGKLVTIERGKGRLLIRFADAIAFEPGRAELRNEGQALLHQLAATMKQVNRDFLVACHADNQPPPKTSPFRSGWELTTARAVAIVRYLQGEGVDPRRLAAAGYSEFDFLADNGDEAGRAQNRRVELVVMPAPDELLPLPPEIEQRRTNEMKAPAPGLR